MAGGGRHCRLCAGTLPAGSRRLYCGPACRRLADQLRRAIIGLLRNRADGASICPSEAARLVAPRSWRALLPAVRRVAEPLAAHGRIVVTQAGRAVDIASARGPVRWRLPAAE
jgi:hypothetical protein